MTKPVLQPKQDRVPTHEERDRFASALAVALLSQHILPADYMELGVALAAMQQPPRPIPYGDFTIKGWIKGDLLPSEPALSALHSYLNERGYPPEKWDNVDQLWDRAADEQMRDTKQPNELTHAYQIAMQRAGLSYRDLAPLAAAWNAREGGKHGHISASGPGIWGVMQGNTKLPPSKYFTYAMGEWTPALEPSLAAIHEQQLRERADSLWYPAAKEGNLGQMIHACRVRLGESTGAFGARLGLLMEREPFSGSCVTYWESNNHIPTGGSHSDSTLWGPIDTLMVKADAADNRLAHSIDQPWYDEAKQVALWEGFKVAVAQSRARSFHPMPEKEAQLPVPENAQPALRTYEGSLRGRIVNGMDGRTRDLFSRAD